METINIVRPHFPTSSKRKIIKLNYRIFLINEVVNNEFLVTLGKDITHKMYSLNEQLGQAKSFDDQTRAARNDHWRQAIYRSVSYDAVNTGTKGTVRSNAWKRYRDRKASLFADPGESGCIIKQNTNNNTYNTVEVAY